MVLRLAPVYLVLTLQRFVKVGHGQLTHDAGLWDESARHIGDAALQKTGSNFLVCGVCVLGHGAAIDVIPDPERFAPGPEDAARTASVAAHLWPPFLACRAIAALCARLLRCAGVIFCAAFLPPLLPCLAKNSLVNLII